MERLRDSCEYIRDLAMIDLLSSMGMRVGELVLLNREDIDFNEREGVVLGKGDKERVALNLIPYYVNMNLFPIKVNSKRR